MNWGIIGTWRMALEAIEEASIKLSKGYMAEDIVEEAVKFVEDHPDYHSVGYSGLPNEEGEVELDAGFMNGDNLSIGAVGGIKDFKNPVSIAKSLMKSPVNNFLIGAGAEKYAHKMGFERRNMTSKESMKKWEERLKEEDSQLTAYDGHDTVGIIGLDTLGTMVAATSTSGLFMKKAGRLGDSVIPGSGYYADSDIGACVATGLGEDIMKGNISFEIVRLMKEGMKPQEAAEKAVRQLNDLLLLKRKKAGDISVVCMNNKGDWGAATNTEHFSFVAANANEDPTVFIASFKDNNLEFKKATLHWINNHTE